MFGKNKDEFSLKEGDVDIITVSNPHLINSVVDPLASITTIANIGYFSQGTLVAGLNDSFAEFLAGTPHKRIRKDLIQRDFSLSFSLAQFNKDVLEMALNAELDDAGLYPQVAIGPDAPVKPRYGLLVRTELVDETPFYIAIWSGEVVTEDKSLNFTGSAHTLLPVMVQAFEHDAFLANPNDKKSYGLIWQDQN